MGWRSHNLIPVHSSEIIKWFHIEKKKACKTYPFDDMEIGDAFFTQNPSVAWSASAYAKINGKTFMTIGNWHQKSKNDEGIEEEKIGWMCGRTA